MNLFAKQTKHHENMVDEYKKDIAEALDKQKKLTNLLVKHLIPQKHNCEKNIAAGERALKSATSQKQHAEEVRATQHKTFEKNVKDLSEAIDAVTRALPILEGLRSSKSMMMFLETNKESMTEAANALTSSFRNMAL